MITGLLHFETPTLLNHYRMNETDVSIDSSECFSLWKEQAKCEVCGIKSDLSVNNDVFQTGYEPKTSLCSTDWALKVHLS